MRVTSIGGGPAALYFAILMKKELPGTDLHILERNRPDDTFGWGVVFSDETLGHFEAADAESYREIRRNFRYWDDIETHHRGTVTTSTGHGFCGMSRRTLLLLLQARCRELGVKLTFEREVDDPARLARECDLLLGADGVNSNVRQVWADQFGPEVKLGRCKFCWLGTTRPLRAFTFIFHESPYGLFQVHAYPFDSGTSTWIVEAREEVWRAAGLEAASEDDTVRFCEELFAPYLDGHRLMKNRSLWRSFPTIHCARWHHENVVLLGDAAHTAHYSIGSGTKLAMEDAIALRDAFRTHGTADVPRALAAYEAARRDDVLRLQKTAQTSLEWFENSARYLGQPPLQFKFNLMSRSKRITYDNLRKRDPELMARVTAWWGEHAGAPHAANGSWAPPIFAPLTLRGTRLENRVVVSPMCQYSSADGMPNDWHLVHLGSRVIGGAGLVMTEATHVSPEGRITYGCAGLWSTEHATAWKRIVDFAHAQRPGARIGMQLAHAGRKASCNLPWEGDDPLDAAGGAWPTIGPSALPYGDGWHVPREMDRADMDRVIAEFVRATRLALLAGFDLLELHGAHGYLLSSFLSPAANRRTDAYGGTLERRMRYPLEIVDAVRAAWPGDRALAMRISATDWVDAGGMTVDDAVELSRALAAHGVDLVDVSSAGNTPASASRIVPGRMFQVPFAERIKYEAGVRVMAVGAILGADHANTIIAAGRADLCAIARAHLRDPYLMMRAAAEDGVASFHWPKQYLLARPRPGQGRGGE